jgi:cobalt transporter subunit CbtB
MEAILRRASDEVGFAVLVLLSLFTFYALALDQGHLLFLVQGAEAFDLNLIHEALHDARHAAGFPCH